MVERSKPELFESLMSSQTLTGRPSACLTALISTAHKVGVSDDFVRHKFLQSLPSNVAPVLATQSSLSLRQLGSLADELLSLTGSQQTSKIEVGAVSSGSQQQHRGTSFQQHQHPSTRPFRSNQRPRICRAHLYYASEARTCRHWCEWPSKDNCRVEANSRANSPATRPLQSPKPRSRESSLNYSGAQ